MVWKAAKWSRVVAAMLLGVLSTMAYGDDTPGKPKEGAISFGAMEQADSWAALSGGRRTGLNAHGQLTLTVNADLGALAGLDGWYLHGSVLQIHGRGVTLDRVGAIQTISGVETTRGTKLYNLWITKTFLDGRLNLRIGQQGANEEMMAAAQAQTFINASFGFPGLASVNLPSGGPNSPLATPMVRLIYNFNEAFSYAGAVFNGDPAGPGEDDPNLRNRYGLAFRLRDAPLVFNELWFRPEGWSAGNLPGLWKIGAWVHTGTFDDQRFDRAGGLLAVTGGDPRRHRGNHAVYAVADQMLWRRPGTEDQGLSVFGLITASPARQNAVDFFMQGGFTFKGPFETRPKDKLGLAFAHLQISPSLRGFYADGFAAGVGLKPVQSSETIAELTYQFVVTDNVMLQPSLQYVVNPGASIPSPANRFSQERLKNATIAGLRLTVNY